MAERRRGIADPVWPASQMAAPGSSRVPPWPAVLFLLACVLPAYFYLGDFLLTPLRLICLIAVVVVSVRLFLLGSYGRLTPVDLLITFYACWVMLSYIVNHGSTRIVLGGLNVVNILGGYLIGRAAIRSVADLQAVARMLATIVIVLMPFAIYESINASYIIPAWIDSIPGISSLNQIDYGRRLGLDRAQVVFAHPIHWGLFCSLPIALYFVGLANQVSLGKRVFVSVLIVGTCFMSLSSGPVLAALFQLMLIFYALAAYALKKQWQLLLWGSAGAYVVGEILSDRFFFYALGSRLAFNPYTAHYRTLIWEYGTAQVERTPWFGIGAGDWERLFWMTSSIDNYWLQLAVVNGLPACFAMVAVFLYTMFRLGRGTYVKGSDAYNMRVAVTILLVGLSLALSTVTIWNELLSIVMFLIGASAFMLQSAPAEEASPQGVKPADPARRGTSAQRPRPVPPSEGPVYTRFGSGSTPGAGSQAAGRAGVRRARKDALAGPAAIHGQRRG